jgi:hypothetical protein
MKAATFCPTVNSPPGQAFDDANTFDTADLGGLGPFSLSHVCLGVVDSERFHLDDHMTRLRFRIWEVVNDQFLWATVLLDDDCFHIGISHV